MMGDGVGKPDLEAVNVLLMVSFVPLPRIAARLTWA
jgi:hypothetical protein